MIESSGELLLLPWLLYWRQVLFSLCSPLGAELGRHQDAAGPHRVVGVSQGSADRTMDVSSTVKGQGGALGGPTLLWTVISWVEPSGSPQLHSVSIQYLTQVTKIVGGKTPTS